MSSPRPLRLRGSSGDTARAMAGEHVEVVRQPVVLQARSRRGLDERLCLRFPSLLAFVARAVWGLPPRSGLRRRFLRRAIHNGFDALNRGDFESSFLLYHPDVELVTPPPLVGLGFHPLYRGRDARKDFQRGWIAEWGEMRFEPEDVRDLGDRVLCVGRMKGSGLTSGAGAESDWACLFTLQAGRVIREQPVFDRREVLEAAGLRE